MVVLKRLDLPVVQFNWSTATEDTNDHGHTSIGFVDSVDLAFETLEVAFLHSHLIARSEWNRGLGYMLVVSVGISHFDDSLNV